VKLYVLPLLSAFALAQSTTTTYTTDINGNRVAGLPPTVSADHTQTQVTQSINGHQVPLEQREEKVLRKDASGSVTETIVRKYTPNGQLASTERVVTEQQNTGAGGSVVRATTYQSDINGQQREVERRTTETRVSGNSTNIETSIARPTINGSFDTTEKRSSVSTGTDASKTTTETVYRPSQNGGLSEALRMVKQETKANGQSVVNIANYEPGMTGKLELHDQTVSTSAKQPDGSETTQVDLYAPAADGHVRESGAKQQIKEEQIITRKVGADGSVTETLSVRRPSVSDATKLGNPQQISQTVCQGKCESAPAPQSVPPTTPKP
jgi:hypothetical protein